MKKVSYKNKRWHDRKIKKKRIIELKISRRKKRNRLLKKQFEHKNKPILRAIDHRNQFKRQHYNVRYSKRETITVNIEGDYGIEERNRIDYTLETASSFIDFDTTKLFINLENCTRVWPSAITLFCSLMQWVELSAVSNRKPKISSSSSKDKRVNSYLNHSGFYDYVKRPKDIVDSYYDDKEIVKIKRETNQSNIEEREEQVKKLLKEFSIFNEEQIELFDNIILTEILLNVSEHGVSRKDKGWWILAQYHKKHKIISLCIADNGIGFRNNLMTGLQKVEIGKRLKDEPANDGKFIKLCLEEEVSGVLHVPPRTRSFLKRKFERGTKRGLGLKRIKETCRELSIPLSILSQHGYIFIDETGNEILCGAKKGRIFAGTLYHLTIKARN